METKNEIMFIFRWILVSESSLSSLAFVTSGQLLDSKIHKKWHHSAHLQRKRIDYWVHPNELDRLCLIRETRAGLFATGICVVIADFAQIYLLKIKTKGQKTATKMHPNRKPAGNLWQYLSSSNEPQSINHLFNGRLEVHEDIIKEYIRHMLQWRWLKIHITTQTSTLSQREREHQSEKRRFTNSGSERWNFR